ncbi:heavy metal translocating P-type ATPase [Lacisediminihabitans sp.]|uniref:heavy metal translocating P-type ATPase n=1 Tax=Lacisediminihabitans sp. TaxID=2787631 RepID=UPI00374D1659
MSETRLESRAGVAAEVRTASRVFARYPVVAATVLVGVLGGVIWLAGAHDVARWVVSGYALVMAAVRGWRMLRDLIRGHAGVDILAIAAILATVAVGEFWASLVIVLMLSGGEALEDFAGRRARRELTALLARAPQSAHRVGDGDSVVEIPIDGVALGDELLVRPGEVVPVDGTLLSEIATFDESQLTGESLPVERGAGELVLSGSVNGESAIRLRATAVAADSQYQRVVQLVASAAQSRAPLVRLADRFAVPFTLVSVAIAGFAWWVSGEPVRFAEVLVVATPCPLLIAAPVAFIAGMSRSAKAGVIVKSGQVLEQLSRVKTVAFDKTGTLTLGLPTVVGVLPRGSLAANDLLSLVASVEQYSPHVLASAIVDAALAAGLALQPATDIHEETAAGVTATVGGRRITVGKRRFVSGLAGEIDSPPPRSGQLAVYAAVDGDFAGEIVLSDRVRDNAKSTLAQLSRLGVRRTILISGDLAATAQHVAEELGITEVRAQCLPEQKVEAVRSITDRPVMMVGDGVNDAPVLAVADIGVAMGARGSTAASESADVVIMVDDLSRVVRAITIGWQTNGTALRAIWLGIALSLALMIVATFGVLPAIVGAALQEVVDLLVILYALRGLVERPDRRLGR